MRYAPCMSARNTVLAYGISTANLGRFLVYRRLWLLMPLIALLLVFFVIIILGSTTPLGPFIYTIF